MAACTETWLKWHWLKGNVVGIFCSSRFKFHKIQFFIAFFHLPCSCRFETRPNPPLIKGCLRLTCGLLHYCILEIKADNEPAISLPVYFKMVKKWKYVLPKTKQNKTKGPKRKESFQGWEWNPEPLTCEVSVLSNVPRQLTLSIFIKIIMLNTFAHEIVPVNAVWSR